VWSGTENRVKKGVEIAARTLSTVLAPSASDAEHRARPVSKRR
jgi:hypothetical protein